MVRAMSGYGVSAADICRVVARTVSEAEFAKACADDLEQGQIQANAKLQEQLYTQAVNGNTAALLHLTRQSGGGHPALCSTVELMGFLGCTKVTISDMERRGVIKREARNMWRLKPCVAAAVAHFREVAAGRASTGDADAPDLVVQRALLAKAQTEGQELRNAELRRELVRADEVEEHWGQILGAARSRLLTLPGRIAANVGVEHAKVERLAREVVHEALLEVQRDAMPPRSVVLDANFTDAD